MKDFPETEKPDRSVLCLSINFDATIRISCVHALFYLSTKRIWLHHNAHTVSKNHTISSNFILTFATWFIIVKHLDEVDSHKLSSSRMFESNSLPTNETNYSMKSKIFTTVEGNITRMHTSLRGYIPSDTMTRNDVTMQVLRHDYMPSVYWLRLLWSRARTMLPHIMWNCDEIMDMIARTASRKKVMFHSVTRSVKYRDMTTAMLPCSLQKPYSGWMRAKLSFNQTCINYWIF